jgi:hypothetical protein
MVTSAVDVATRQHAEHHDHVARETKDHAPVAHALAMRAAVRTAREGAHGADALIREAPHCVDNSRRERTVESPQVPGGSLLPREQFGYYADPVDERTATLPAGWKGRLVRLAAGDTAGAQGFCLDPHDLVISKYVARREKDLAFNGALARRGIVAQKRLLALLEKTPVAEAVCERIRRDIARDFDGQTSPDEK